MTQEAAMPFFVLVAAVLLDRMAGEPPSRWHPLAGFGKLASLFERAFRRPQSDAAAARTRGALCVMVLILPISLLTHAISRFPGFGAVFDILVLYLVIAPRSLEEHARAVAGALEQGNIEQARAAVGRIVSRDTGAMAGEDVARATVESVLENGNDAVFGAVFWFVLLGTPGAVAYRLANTLDAMWGYKSEAYLHFGWAAARLDDLLNLLPARLTALTYSLSGKTCPAVRCWRTQGPAWYSPNAGPVMAAGAGALEVRLGGPASYAGRTKARPILGCGAAPGIQDIERALRLIRHGLLVWTAMLGLLCLARALA